MVLICHVTTDSMVYVATDRVRLSAYRRHISTCQIQHWVHHNFNVPDVNPSMSDSADMYLPDSLCQVLYIRLADCPIQIDFAFHTVEKRVRPLQTSCQACLDVFDSCRLCPRSHIIEL